jgi:hypothetical protein
MRKFMIVNEMGGTQWQMRPNFKTRIQHPLGNKEKIMETSTSSPTFRTN